MSDLVSKWPTVEGTELLALTEDMLNEISAENQDALKDIKEVDDRMTLVSAKIEEGITSGKYKMTEELLVQMKIEALVHETKLVVPKDVLD